VHTLTFVSYVSYVYIRVEVSYVVVQE
jgi:hypothetical protein